MECPICYEEIDVDIGTLELLKTNNECNVIHPRRIENDSAVKLVCGHVFIVDHLMVIYQFYQEIYL